LETVAYIERFYLNAFHGSGLARYVEVQDSIRLKGFGIRGVELSAFSDSGVG
jgi:hypothetical protein